ncbi:hypothetical protein NA57DRAFT_81357 [Rhizodiscina lignyota]|uniref:Ricin B lectin domain-containing protein n=1 Tax=Rhizodiscina lignyota TaxID=1504668 RepID=A0A9P4M1G5_9PEZI|nr:hypothetical protein NA57DRAFT_81357 [Rhizodiscina lignyota]
MQLITTLLCFAATTSAWTLSQYFDQSCSHKSTNDVSSSAATGCNEFDTTPGSITWEGQDGFELTLYTLPDCIAEAGNPLQDVTNSGCYRQSEPNLPAQSWKVGPVGI